MKKERKELMKQFKNLINDLLDNYEKYTSEEKKQIKQAFEKVSELNKTLDKYDVEKKFNWVEYLAACNDYFDMMGF